jgi:transcription antitermination factor NusG
MIESEQPKHWFALYTKPRHECKARNQINSLGVENYLPMITTKRKWSDRIKSVSEPFIRGYIFIYGNEKERLCAITAGSVIQTVCFNGIPAVIPFWQIESLQKMLQHPDEIFISDKFTAGTFVKVISGPMCGISGIVEENNNNEKSISITIEIINRTVSVKLPADSITKIVNY